MDEGEILTQLLQQASYLGQMNVFMNQTKQLP